MKKVILIAIAIQFLSCKKTEYVGPKIEYKDYNDYVLRVECDRCELNLTNPKQINEVISGSKGYLFNFDDLDIGRIIGTVKNTSKKPVVVYAWSSVFGKDRIYTSNKIQSEEENIPVSIVFKKETD